jgi:hypothetical protein
MVTGPKIHLAVTLNMKYAQWTESKGVSVNSEILNLQEVEANLNSLLAPLKGDAAGRVAEALSFLRQAIQALAGREFEAKR